VAHMIFRGCKSCSASHLNFSSFFSSASRSSVLKPASQKN
jgi:hypothetical protein